MSNARPTDISGLCQFQFANGRCCSLPAHPEGQGLCLTHFRRTQARPNRNAEQREDDLSLELAHFAGDYITNIDINHVLGKLYEALAANRLSPRRATALAYIACLLLQSQKGAVNEARCWVIDYPVFKKLLQLKYPKGRPNRAASTEKQSASATAKPAPANKPAAQTKSSAKAATNPVSPRSVHAKSPAAPTPPAQAPQPPSADAPPSQHASMPSPFDAPLDTLPIV